MTRHAISADPARYPCAHLGCDARSVVVTTGEYHGAVYGHCPDHLPDAVTFPVEVLERWVNGGYVLECGHVVTVDGPCGPTTGRAWCEACGESRAVANGS